MGTTVQSSFGWAHSYDGEKFSEYTAHIPRWEFPDSPTVTKILSTSVAGYIEANIRGTKISYVTERK